MARITVEDCLENVDNRFELVLVSAKRARQLSRGADAKLPWENDKTTVMALREIAEGLVLPATVDTMVQPPAEEPEELEAAEPPPPAQPAE